MNNGIIELSAVFVEDVVDVVDIIAPVATSIYPISSHNTLYWLYIVLSCLDIMM